MAKGPEGKIDAPPSRKVLATREGLEAWLRTQPREVSVAIAARAALRVLPLWETARPENSREFADLTVALFRATGLARAAAKYPTRANDLRAASATGATRATRAAFAANTNVAADAAAAAAVAAAAHTARAAAAAAAYIAAVSAASPDAAKLVQDPASLPNILDAPLWPQGAPVWATEAWTRLRARLPLEDDWQVWIDWYEDRLRGGSRGEAYELVFATVPEAEWAKGAKAANEWIAAHLPPEIVGDNALEQQAAPPRFDPAALEQKAAPHIFRLAETHIVASPDVGAPDNPQITHGFLDAARKRVAQLQKRAAHAQADAYLRDHLDDAAALLQNPLDEIDLGQLVPLWEDLESDYRNYNSPEGRAEHAVDLIAGLDSVAKSLRRLVAQYPEAKAIVANQTELALARDLQSAERLRAALASLAATAESATEFVDPSAVAALRAFEKAERDSRTLADRIGKLALGVLDALNFARIVAWLGDQSRRAASATTRTTARKVAAGLTALVLIWDTPHGAQLIRHTLNNLTEITSALGDAAERMTPAVHKIDELVRALRELEKDPGSVVEPRIRGPKQNKPRLPAPKAKARDLNEPDEVD